MALTEKQKTLVFHELKERIALAKQKGQIDNSSLRAGSPMYYYCELCGLHVQTLAESDFQTKIRKHCTECDRLFKEHGLKMEEVRKALGAA